MQGGDFDNDVPTTSTTSEVPSPAPGALTFGDSVLWDPHRQIFTTGSTSLNPSEMAKAMQDALTKMKADLISQANNQKLIAALNSMSGNYHPYARVEDAIKEIQNSYGTSGESPVGDSYSDVSGQSQISVDGDGEASAGIGSSMGDTDYTKPADTQYYTYTWDPVSGDWTPVHKSW